MKTFKYILLFSLIALFTSCGPSTKTTSSWKAPEVANNFLNGKNIMVVALLPDKDRELQKQMEEKIVSGLIGKGLSAESGFATFGPKYLPQSEKKALQTLSESGADAVLTVVLLDKNKQKNYTPGNVSVRPIGYYRNWYGYYRTVYTRVYRPGYYTTSTTLIWESNLYDLGRNQLLYSTQSETFDPSSISKIAMDYSKTLVDDMARQGLVISKKDIFK
ncbi:MAG: hypothetical protein ABI266_07165 [Ginsengibacter sp.]